MQLEHAAGGFLEALGALLWVEGEPEQCVEFMVILSGYSGASAWMRAMAVVRRLKGYEVLLRAFVTAGAPQVDLNSAMAELVEEGAGVVPLCPPLAPTAWPSASCECGC